MRLAQLAYLPVLAPGAALAEGYDEGRYYHHMGAWDGGWGYGFMGFGMLLFWALVVLLVVLALRWVGDGALPGRQPSALDVLKERLAKGEIDIEDYEARRKTLEG